MVSIKILGLIALMNNDQKIVSGEMSTFTVEPGKVKRHITEKKILRFLIKDKVVCGYIPANEQSFEYFNGKAIRAKLFTNNKIPDNLEDNTLNAIVDLKKGIVFVNKKEIRVMQNGFETIQPFDGEVKTKYDKTGKLQTIAICNAEIEDRDNAMVIISDTTIKKVDIKKLQSALME